MNEDEFYNILMNHRYSNTDSWSYELLKTVREGYKMPYYYDYDRYSSTRGDEVATAVLEAYAAGVEFTTLIKKNKQVRQYWSQVQNEKIEQEKLRVKEEACIAKLAERRAIEQAKREEVMKKLTPEELEVFGLVKKPRKVAKK